MTDAQLVSQAEKVFKEAIQIASNSDGWKLEKEDKVNQVTVEMKKNAEGRKIYLCKVRTSSMLHCCMLCFTNEKQLKCFPGQDQHAGQAADQAHQRHGQHLLLEQDSQEVGGPQEDQRHCRHQLSGQLIFRCVHKIVL